MAWFEAWRRLTEIDEAAANAALESMPREYDSLERQIRDNPDCRVFAVTSWDWTRIEPMPKLAILPAKPSDRSYLVECMWTGAREGERCFVGVFMPERYCERFYVYHAGCVVKTWVDADEYVPSSRPRSRGSPGYINARRGPISALTSSAKA